MKAIQTNNQGGKLSSKFNFKNNNYIKFNHNLNKTGLLSAFTFLLLALTCLFPISKGEQNTEAVTGTVQSSSLTLNVSKSAASVELDVNSMAGTFASSTTDNSAAFSVTTNNFSGYTLTISGNDDEGKLYDSTKQNFLSSLTNATTETDFASTSGTDLNGKWGYKPSKFNSALNDNYLPAPTTEASTIDTTAAANTTANSYSISLGLRADYTTLADTYTNTFIITAVPNPIAYVITYDANTTDTVSNMPAAQNSTTSATSITLSDKSPTRENYDFKGWCTVAPTTSNPDICSGITFQPGGTYGIDQTSENITTLYAMWKKQIIYIQDYSYAQCSTEAVSAPVTVVDKRDNKEYTVRYINGLCTMTQNLKIDEGQVMTPEDTNIVSDYTMPSNDLAMGDGYYTVEGMHTGDTADEGNWYNYCAATAGTICNYDDTEVTQDICPRGWRLPTGGYNFGEQYILNNRYISNSFNPNYPKEFNPIAAGYYESGSLNNHGSDGYWWSSTAHSSYSTYIMVYSTSGGLSSGDGYSRDLGLSVRCVKAKPGVTISFYANGGTGTMDTQKIDAGQSANLTANTFTRTNYVFTGWNTKADGSGTSYADAALYAAPASEDNQIVVLYAQWGINMLDDVTYMQDLTATHCFNSYDGATATLKDARDNKTYTIAKINGRCWMTQNLNFNMTSGMTLSSDTTNVTANRTIATVGSLTTKDNTGSYTQVRTVVSSNTSYGTYYNYCAATAGTICANNLTGSVDESSQDICPKGWRLPTGDNNGEQKLLTNNIFGSYQVNYPQEFTAVVAGNYSNGSLLNSATSGYWWSSTAVNGTERYLLHYTTSSGLYSGIRNYRYYGYSVRCIRAEIDGDIPDAP